MSGNDRKHIADELDFQVKRIWGLLGDLPPTGGLGWGTLKFEELADVCKRASDALRGIHEEKPAEDPCCCKRHNPTVGICLQCPVHGFSPQEVLVFHTGTTGE